MSNYTLEIISHHPTFRNKSLRQYYVDGINTIGAWGNEPFEIKFTNNTWQKVQVKLSLDGIDVLTGELASTESAKNMWVVNGYGSLSLKAWPETNNGGAQFVFTSADNSVAVHTHGDLSCRGIIAAAVFVEGYVEPVRVNPIIIHEHHPYPYYPNYPIWTYGGTRGSSFGTLGACPSGSLADSVVDCLSYNSTETQTSCANTNVGDATKTLEGLVAVGAGQYVDQKISYVTGLIKPVFTESIRVRFMWWDDLVSKLKANHVPTPHASGFPGDKNQTHISLGKTPRIGNFNGPAFPKSVEPTYLRV